MVKIFIIDDRAEVRKGLRMQLSLESDFVIVGEAEGGSSALEAIPTVNPDVIILDCEMPVMDGFSAWEKLRKLTPQIPVIMLSIYDCPEERNRAIAEGLSAFIVKDGEQSSLFNAIYDAVNKRPLTYRSES